MDNSTPKYVLVEEHIKRGIKQKLIVGKLPGERRLAKELGFSYMTVRKAIENLVNQGLLYKIPTKGTYVTDRKKAKKQTRNIGYFLDSSIFAGISSPYYSLIFHALEKEVTAKGYSLVYFSELKKGNIHETIDKLDGVIASCFPRVENIIHEINDILPVVVIDNSSVDKSIPSIIIDNFNAIRNSFDYLISLGHRRIGFISGLEDSNVSNDRLEGYLNRLKHHRIKYDNALVYKGNFSYESGTKAAEYYLQLRQAPTAIICANDSMALGAIKMIHQAGFNVPEDISIIGFDDIKVASQIYPALTTAVAPIDEIAKYSVDMLIRLIRNKVLADTHIALQAPLRIRQSCYDIKKHQVA